MQGKKIGLLLLILAILIGGVFIGTEAFCANQMATDSYSFTIIPDTTAPAAVSNLSITQALQNSITVSWTAPGDDGATGTATSYDIRYSTAAINASNWASATQVSGEPLPQAAGSTQTMTVSGLSAATTYYFAIKVTDDSANVSALSNVINDTTNVLPDTTPPYTTGHVPAKSATGISANSNVILHVKDDGAGVDVNSIVMTVNGQVVVPVITGVPADYILTYDHASDFLTGQVINVTVGARDLAP